MSDIRNPLLLQAAIELAGEIRDGKWRHVLELEAQPPHVCAEIVAELRSRCPGFTRAEYETAIAEGLLAPRPRAHRSSHSTWFYWAIAFTFIWALLVATVGLKKVPGLNQWVGFFLYPAFCAFGAIYVLRAKRNSSVVIAILNVGFGVAWMILEMWVADAFARSFWR